MKDEIQTKFHLKTFKKPFSSKIPRKCYVLIKMYALFHCINKFFFTSNSNFNIKIRKSKKTSH